VVGLALAGVVGAAVVCGAGKLLSEASSASAREQRRRRPWDLS
jgi:hypothetical protein